MTPACGQADAGVGRRGCTDPPPPPRVRHWNLSGFGGATLSCFRGGMWVKRAWPRTPGRCGLAHTPREPRPPRATQTARVRGGEAARHPRTHGSPHASAVAKPACVCALARCSWNILEPVAGRPNLNTALDMPLPRQVAERNSQCDFHENLRETSVFLGLKNK